MIWNNNYRDVETARRPGIGDTTTTSPDLGPVPACPPLHFFASLGLKKLVNLDIDDVLTFLSASTPLEAGGAFRFVPALAPLDELTIGADAAAATAARFARYSDSAEKLYAVSERFQGYGGG
jgi:hypothetical protein